MRKIIIGSRESQLALTQTNWVIERLKEEFPQYDYEVVRIKTIGDKILDKTFDKIGGKGLFVKEIERALLNKQIDMAVHSMKDVPTKMIDGLMIGAITHREDMRDVFISRNGKTLKNLPNGARIGTSSLRRKAQLMAFRPDFVIEPIRGNIATRIKKMETLKLDGIILAAAGMIRMGWKDQITEFIHQDICTCAVGQGALGIEIRRNDPFIQSMVSKLNHRETEIAIKAERSFMGKLEGGCHVPIGAYGYIDHGKLHMITVIASPDGKKQIRLQNQSDLNTYEELGIKMAMESLEKGGEDILKAIKAGD